MEVEDKYTFEITVIPVFDASEDYEIPREHVKRWIQSYMDNLVDQQCEIERIEVE